MSHLSLILFSLFTFNFISAQNMASNEQINSFMKIYHTTTKKDVPLNCLIIITDESGNQYELDSLAVTNYNDLKRITQEFYNQCPGKADEIKEKIKQVLIELQNSYTAPEEVKQELSFSAFL